MFWKYYGFERQMGKLNGLDLCWQLPIDFDLNELTLVWIVVWQLLIDFDLKMNKLAYLNFCFTVASWCWQRYEWIEWFEFVFYSC